MELTDLQKLDLKLTTRTALLLKTLSEMTDTIVLASKTNQAQTELNDALTQKVLGLQQRLESLESWAYHKGHSTQYGHCVTKGDPR